MTQLGEIPAAQLRRLRVAQRRTETADAELKAAVAAAAAAGGSVRVIAAELGRSPPPIQRWITERRREDDG